MKWIARVRSVPTILLYLFLLAFGFIIVMEAWLLDVPEFVPWGEEFGRVFSGLCQAVVAGFVFYFFFVHVKFEEDREIIEAFVVPKCKRIVAGCKTQVGDLKWATQNSSPNSFLDLDDLGKIFQRIRPNGPSTKTLPPLPGRPKSTWLQYMVYHVEETRGVVQQILIHVRFLEPRLIALLTKIQDCGHFSQVEHALAVDAKNSNMLPYASLFHEYSLLCQELENVVATK